MAVLTGACGGGATATAPTPVTPPTVEPPSEEQLFRVVVLLSSTKVPGDGDVQRVFARANDILFQKTGERMSQLDVVTLGPGSPLTQAVDYVNAHAASPPDGILAFADDFTAITYGGYSQTFALPAGHVNRFPSPVVGAYRGYLAVVHFFHLYARCGYDSAGNRVSNRSTGGECRNRTGLTCVSNGRYWMCPDAVDDLYADADYFTGCSVVHEFMHPFGTDGNFDHYGTTQCMSRTGMSQADAQNVALFQQNCGMCPDLYGKFRHR